MWKAPDSLNSNNLKLFKKIENKIASNNENFRFIGTLGMHDAWQYMMSPESQLIFNNKKEENLKFEAYNFNEKCSGNLLFDENGKITKFFAKNKSFYYKRTKKIIKILAECDSTIKSNEIAFMFRGKSQRPFDKFE